MGTPNEHLHGGDASECGVALLLVDVINPLDFPEADQLLAHALPAAKALAVLKKRAVAAGVPVIYANDNFGRWRSDLSAVVDECSKAGCKGRPLADLLRPEPDDYFVLKPKHSAFYCTALDVLLAHLGTHTLVVGGLAGDICVLFTAHDAHMRDFAVVVPADTAASNTRADNDVALDQLRKLRCATPMSAEVDFAALGQGG